MIFLLLILGHLLADFIFQPQTLIEWKNKSWMGVSVHAAIHLLVEILLFLPVVGLDGVLPVILGIVVLHFVIDRLKIQLEHRENKFVILFFIDQFAHFSVILLGGFLLGKILMSPPRPLFTTGFLGDPFIVLYFILAIPVTIGLEIVRLQFALEKNPTLKLAPDFVKVFLRLAVFTFLYIILVFSISHFFPA